MADFEYLIQVFVSFAPLPQFQPMLLRVAETATVVEAIDAALSRVQAPEAGNVRLPSAVSTHYALCHALGDGSVDPAYHAPLELQSVIRDAQLQFPYMLTLLHVGGDAKASFGRMSESARNASPSALAKALTAAERDAAAERAAELQRRREENVRKIDDRRTANDVSHFHKAESYELRRREEAAARQEKEVAAERAVIAAKIEAEARAKEAEKRATEAQRVELEGHRKRMQELKDAEAARLEDARRAQAAHEATLAEGKRRAADQRRQELEATKNERMNRALDAIVSDLDVAVERGRDEKSQMAERQFEERAAAARTARELREVQALEAARAEQHAAKRDRRTAEEQLVAERRRLAELAAIEEEERKKDHEASRFDEWRSQQRERLTQVEGELELVYRIKNNSSGTSFGGSPAATR
jgi:hypothetical protein